MFSWKNAKKALYCLLHQMSIINDNEIVECLQNADEKHFLNRITGDERIISGIDKEEFTILSEEREFFFDFLSSVVL